MRAISYLYTDQRLEHFRSRDNLYISIPKNPDDIFARFPSISLHLQLPNRASSLLLNFYRGTEFVEANIYTYIYIYISVGDRYATSLGVRAGARGGARGRCKKNSLIISAENVSRVLVKSAGGSM